MHDLISPTAGTAIAGAMTYLDTSDVDLERLEAAPSRGEAARRRRMPCGD